MVADSFQSLPGPEAFHTQRTTTSKRQVFGFAIVAWEIATLQKPWFGYSRRQVLERVLGGHRPPLDAAWPADFVRLLRDCWNQDPAKRPEFRTILRRLAAESFVVPEM